MRSWAAAIRVEVAKLRSSYVLWGTLAFFLFVTSIRLGEADWTTYLQNVVFMFATVFGLIGFGIVSSWAFGREYTERTFKDLLALPVTRGKIVAAKSISAMLWSLTITMLTYEFAVWMGVIAGIPDFSIEVVRHFLVQMLIISGMHLLLCGPVVWLASVSRGYLLPLAYAFTTLMIALVAGPTSLGPYLPWSVPALQLARSDSSVLPLDIWSYIIPVIVGTAGFAGTWAWWRWADHK